MEKILNAFAHFVSDFFYFGRFISSFWVYFSPFSSTTTVVCKQCVRSIATELANRSNDTVKINENNTTCTWYNEHRQTIFQQYLLRSRFMYIYKRLFFPLLSNSHFMTWKHQQWHFLHGHLVRIKIPTAMYLTPLKCCVCKNLVSSIAINLQEVADGFVCTTI